MTRPTTLRLALLGAIAALPAAAQLSPTTPEHDRPAATTKGSTHPGEAAPAPNAGGANQPAARIAQDEFGRVDSVRPDRPTQALDAGQGVAVPATPPPRDDTVTGTTSPMRGATGGQGASLGQLERGANSFTESQARSRIEAAGFSNVQALSKDDSGIWRGRAMRGGQQVEVGLDYRGTVAELRWAAGQPSRR